MPSDSPFHPGEQLLQTRAGVRERMDQRAGRAIRNFMPDQHRAFFAGLRYVFVAFRGGDGWPVATVMAGPAGFIESPNDRVLRIAARPHPLMQEGAPVGLLGIDLSTRRRNRANGKIAAAWIDGFEVSVNQSFGNCAQYIQRREVVSDAVVRDGLELLDGLDSEAQAAIRAADTLFVASGFGDTLDISHRGGLPGFVRTDATSLEIPDFAGNNYFNTLGNLALDPRASLLFPDFATGDLLHVSGLAEILWETRGLAGAQRLWRLRVTSVFRRRAALPYRWRLIDYAPTTLATGTWG